MVRLLHLAGYKKIFATASAKHHDFLHSLGATDLFDYNRPTLIDDINNAVGGAGKLTMAVDCITAESTMDILAKILSPTGSVALLMPVKEGTTLNNALEDKLYLDLPIPDSLNPFQKGTNIIGVRTFLYQTVRAFFISFLETQADKLNKDEVLKENLLPVILPDLLERGLITPTRLRLMDQGTLQQRVEQALDLFRTNKVSGEKLVVRIN